MQYPETVVSVHPYIRAHPGKLADLKAMFPAFVARTASEPANLYYEFTVNGDVIYCREAYVDAAGVLAHFANVGELIEQQLKVGSIIRLEFHGPAAELDKLRPTLAKMNPEWFVKEAGVAKG